jgi:alpha-tubulin suppressor-like RCC1 family protein
MGLLGNPSVPLGDTKTFNETPVRVESTAIFTSIVMEQYFACAIDTASAAWCWGEPGGLGRLGNGAGSGLQRAPVKVSGGLSFKSLSVGVSHACGLTTGNVAYCWGWGGSGSLGYGGTDTRSVPTKVGLQR